MLSSINEPLEIRVLVSALQNQECDKLTLHFEKCFTTYTSLGSSEQRPIKWLFAIDKWSSEGRDTQKIYDLGLIFFHCNKLTEKKKEEADFYPLFKYLHENNLRPLDQQIPGRVLLVTVYANETLGSSALHNLLAKSYFEDLYKSESKINFNLDAITLCAYQEEEPENEKRWCGKNDVQKLIDRIGTELTKEENLSFKARTRFSYYHSHSCPSASHLSELMSSTFSKEKEQSTEAEDPTDDKTPRRGSLPILLESTKSMKRMSRVFLPLQTEDKDA